MENPKVLVIEDEQVNCMIYDNILSRMNFTSSFCHDGLSGLREFVKNKYDIILLDIGLPNISGIDVARYMRIHELMYSLPKIPIIVITADDTPQTYHRAMEAGADEYLNKPFSVPAFKELLNKFSFSLTIPRDNK